MSESKAGSGTETGYKFITSEMASKYDPSCIWKVGDWKKAEGKLSMCENGFHDCDTPLKSLHFVYGDRWFITETRGKSINDSEKSDHSEMRLVREIDAKKACLRFSIACARRSLHNFEAAFPKDDRPRKAIEAAEAYLKDPSEKNRSAAWSAESAARSAAESTARSAAESAARSAAESAAWSAAESAARSAESAAWSAESAAWSAESAARSAESAARSAAESAEMKWQDEALKSIIMEGTSP